MIGVANDNFVFYWYDISKCCVLPDQGRERFARTHRRFSGIMRFLTAPNTNAEYNKMVDTMFKKQTK